MARYATGEKFLFERPRGGRAGRRRVAERRGVRLEVSVRDDGERECEDARDTDDTSDMHGLASDDERAEDTF